MQKEISTVYDCDNEEAMLQHLSDNVSIQMQHDIDKFDSTLDYDISTFTITVNNISHEFILGGPQSAALDKFIEHICYENGYSVK